MGVARFLHLAMILGAFAIGITWVGYIARLVRASMLEVMGTNHIRTARAFGLPERRVVFRYALRVAIIPTIAIVAVGFGSGDANIRAGVDNSLGALMDWT